MKPQAITNERGTLRDPECTLCGTAQCTRGGVCIHEGLSTEESVAHLQSAIQPRSDTIVSAMCLAPSAPMHVSVYPKAFGNQQQASDWPCIVHRYGPIRLWSVVSIPTLPPPRAGETVTWQHSSLLSAVRGAGFGVQQASVSATFCVPLLLNRDSVNCLLRSHRVLNCCTGSPSMFGEQRPFLYSSKYCADPP